MLYQMLEKSGLHPTEFQLVEFIASNQMLDGWCAVSKNEIAKKLKISPSRVFYLLHSLVQKGFLLKGTKKNTKRHSLYKTTDLWKEFEEINK